MHLMTGDVAGHWAAPMFRVDGGVRCRILRMGDATAACRLPLL